MTGEKAPTHAMVLAAGLGLRMRPLTLTRPKPLLTVAGTTLLDHALDRLAAAGVGTAVVNYCYLGDMIAAHLEGRSTPRIILSPESEPLETGGGIKRALYHFGTNPFVSANADILWLDGAVPAVTRLARAWDEREIDALLLLMPTAAAHGYHGNGDFEIEPDGRLRRPPAGAAAPFVFSGVQIIAPRLFADSPDGAFSTNLVWNRALAAGRLRGLVHDGEWFHVGTPEALLATNDWFERHGDRVHDSSRLFVR
ncbi:MAG: nucleotidyltransferase family protein [Rhodospirillaceae bacterium]